MAEFGKDADRARIKRLAREVFEGGRSIEHLNLDDGQTKQLLHELGVSHAELLAQNEELIDLRNELENERNKYRNLYHFAPLGYLSLDDSGKILEANRAFCRIFGIDREEVIGAYFKEFISRNEAQKLHSHISKAAGEGLSASCEFDVPGRAPADLGRISVEFRPGSEIDQADGCLAAVIDISEQYESELRISRLNELKEKLLGSGDLTEKLKLITGELLVIANVELAGIWLIGKGDLCESGCAFAEHTGADGCGIGKKCMHLAAISGEIVFPEVFTPRAPYSRFDPALLAPGKEPGFPAGEDIFAKSVADWEGIPETGLTYSAGYRLTSRKGEPIGVLVLFSDRPFTAMDNDLLQSVANMASGVIQRSFAEEELRQSEFLLKKTQAIGRIGSWRLDLKTNELIWSDEVYRLFGLRPQEFKATYEAFLEHVHPEDRAEVDAAYSGSLRKNSDAYEIEHRIVRRKTGEILYVHEKCEHVKDPSGRIIRSIGSVQDITERKNAEFELQKLRRSVENSSASIIITDTEGKIEYVNPGFSDTTGFSREEAVGLNTRVLKSGLHEDALYEKLWRTIKAGKTWRGEICNRKRNGDLYWEFVSISPVWDQEGKICNFVAIMEDITDKKDLEILKEDVGRIMRHDLKTPLNSIIPLPELLRMEGNLTKEQLQFVGIIEISARKMARMIDLSLDMFKMEIGAYVYEPEYLDVISIAENLISQNQILLSSKKVAARILVDGRPLAAGEKFPVMTEERLMDQLLSNLLVNAVEASPKGGEIVLEMKNQTEKIIEVRNSGAVPSPIRGNFFEKYKTFGKNQGPALEPIPPSCLQTP